MYGFRVIYTKPNQSTLEKMYVTSTARFETMDQAYVCAMDACDKSELRIECIVIFERNLTQYEDQFKNLED